ncbi:MAG TPA: MFS transporter [Syntrophorhabdales bacterium]|nr:MFS transporter [Syntrophorhabdales bacterium]
MARFHALKGKALVFLLFVWFLWFMNFVSRAILSPALPLIEDEFGVTHARATSIFLFLGLGYALSVFFSGVYARMLGSRKSVCAALLFLGLSLLAISQVRTFDLFYLFSFTLGLGAGMYLPAMIPILTEYYDQRDWGKVIAIHDSGSPLGLFATPFIVIVVLLFLPWRGMLMLIATVYFVCAVMFYFWCDEAKIAAKVTYFPRHLLRRGDFWCFGIVWIFMAGATMGPYFVVPLYLTKELSFSVESGNVIFGVSRIGGALAGISAGFLVDRFRVKGIAYFMVLTTGILTVLMAVRDVRWVQVFLFLQATAVTGFFPISLVSVSRMFNSEERGQAVGFIVTLGVIGMAVIPYFLGLAGDLVSFRLGFVLLGIVTGLSGGLLYFVKGLR